MNTNPSLLLGLAMRYCDAKKIELRPADRDQLELRIYPPTGAGYWFCRAAHAGRWYWIEETGADHFEIAIGADILAAIKTGVHVQAVGYQRRPLATWATWTEFKKDAGG